MFILHSVEGNRQKLDGGSMFGNAPRALWKRWHKPDSEGRIELACRSLLIVGEKKILCETGIGAFFSPELAERFGVETPRNHKLEENLRQIGHPHESIDYVVLSHLHFDHAGGLLPPFHEMEQGNNKLLFPHAKYITSKKAWERAINPHRRDRASFIPELMEKIKNSGRLLLLEEPYSEHPLGKAFSFFETNGHTPGQIHLVCRGKKQKIVFCGDMIPGSTWVNPSLSMGYDRNAELVLDEKNSFLKKAKQEKMFLFFTHDPQYSSSQVEEKNSKLSAVNLKETYSGERL